MVKAIATVTEMQNNFSQYLDIVLAGNEVVVTKNGEEIGRFIPKDTAVSYLTDSLTGILKGDYDLARIKDDYKQLLEDELRAKYEITD